MSFGTAYAPHQVRPEEYYWESVELTLEGCHVLKKGPPWVKFMERSWDLWKASYPRLLHVDSACGTPRCVRPEHLETASRLCRSGLHPMVDSNRFKHSGKYKCRQCFMLRKCKRCNRVIDEANTYYRGDEARGCLWCYRASTAVKAKYKKLIRGRVAHETCTHVLIRSNMLVHTWRGYRCSICWSQRVCDKGHLLEGNSFTHEMRISGKIVTVERCTTCRENLYKLCSRGHDLGVEDNVYVRPDGLSRCCRICRDANNKNNPNRRIRRESTPEEMRVHALKQRLRSARKMREDPEGRKAFLADVEDNRRYLYRLDKFLKTGDPARVHEPQKERYSRHQAQVQTWIQEYGDLFSQLP